MQLTYITLIALSTLIMASIAIPLMIYLTQWFSNVAEVNDRSNHKRPVPTGIGVAFIVVMAGFMIIGHAPTPIVLGAIGLSVLGFLDDSRGLSVRTRMAAQLVFVLYGLSAFEGEVFQGLFPFWLDRIFVALFWLWLINLTNFMDGIDEITIMQIAPMCLGMIVLEIVHTELAAAVAIDAALVLAGLLAFYPYNKHPAHCFMGDAGSVPLGFVTAYLLFYLAQSGYWVAAMILPAYYITDASLTLMKRALSGEKVWQAHSQHYYQQAVRAGLSHVHVTRYVLVTNLIFIVLAVTASLLPTYGWIFMLLAYMLAMGLCMFFGKSESRITHVAEPSA